MDLSHSYGPACPLCPGRHNEPAHCDLSTYSVGWLRFVNLHWEEFETVLHDVNGAAAPLALALRREWVSKPPRHWCTCNPYHCPACAALQPSCARCGSLPWLSRPTRCPDCERVRARPSRAEIGRTRPVHAPAPDSSIVDYVTGYALSSARRGGA